MNLKEQHNRETQKKIDEKRDRIEDLEIDIKNNSEKVDNLKKDLNDLELEIGHKMIEKKTLERDIESLTSLFWNDSR